MLTGEQIQAARALVRMLQSELASASGVALVTIKRLEATRGTIGAQLRTVLAIKAALEAAGVIFIDANGEGPGVRLRASPPPSQGAV